MNKTIRNIGIFAHVDAGKTSLTENMLYLSGATQSLGSVDDGTTTTDFLEVEKKRGISVRSSLTSFYWQKTKINLVDTPGHVDFSADVERVLQVIDGAVLIISAIEGVQAHTDAIWQALKERQIPTLFFVNKVDRPGVYIDGLLEDIKEELSNDFVCLQTVEGEGTAKAVMKRLPLESSEESIEKIANVNDTILELFLEEGSIKKEVLQEAFKEAVSKGELCPLLFGSAKMQWGIYALLQHMVTYLPPATGKPSNELSGLVYSLFHEPKQGKIAYVRLFEGNAKVRELISNYSQDKAEKITQLQEVIAGNFKAIAQAEAGDIVAISGLQSAQTGDILGVPSERIPDKVSLNTSLLTVQVKAEQDKDYAALAQALQKLSVEDPALEFEWYREDKEMHVKVMGQIQVEVLEQIILQRFGIAAIFENPTVVYKETPLTSGYGIGHYTMPKPCWAIVRFLIEPAPRGSGVSYKSLVRTSDIHQKYQNEVERTIPKALKQGIKGWEVTDLNITLVEGEDHQMHSRPGNFVLATPMGIMNALNDMGTKFLEPILSFKITASDDLLGKITSEIIQMRGRFDSPTIVNNKMTLTGTMPLASSLDFPIKLNSISGGKAKLLTQFHAYEECDASLCQTRPFKGISPLDRSKYILKMRKALE